MAFSIGITGYEELQRKLDYHFLADAAIQEGLETIGKRIQRGGKGLGAQRNSIGVNIDPLRLAATTTLHSPRRTGSSWLRKNVGIVRSMLPRVLRRAAERITQRFES